VLWHFCTLVKISCHQLYADGAEMNEKGTQKMKKFLKRKEIKNEIFLNASLFAVDTT
jgi:hypothetical protein